MPKIESVSAYARSLGKGVFWYASWHEHGKRVIRPSGLEYNAKRKDGGKGAAIEIGHSIRDERAQKKDAPAPTFAKFAGRSYAPDGTYLKRQADKGKPLNAH
jgi:hypothetical protein